MRASALLIYVALKDYWKDFRYSLVSALGLAAILLPILVLFGLKNGIVEELFEKLRNDPAALELKPLGQGEFGDSFFSDLIARDDVAFVVENTRYLSSTIQLRNRASRKIPPLSGELVPTGPGDPLGGLNVKWIGKELDVAISKPIAEKLNVDLGQEIRGRIERILNGKYEAFEVSLSVREVIPIEKSSRDLVLVPISFLLAAEAYREGFAVPEFGGIGKQKQLNDRRSFAGFRLYASNLEGVASLREYLVGLGIHPQTALARIELIQNLDRVLSVIFWVISGLASIGYVFAASLQSSLVVIRKTADLGVLKLLGFSSLAVAFFPVIQAVLTAILGASLAVGSYYLAEGGINDLLKDIGILDGVAANLPFQYAFLAIGLTVFTCVLTSLAAGFRASKISPAEGLRHE